VGGERGERKDETDIGGKKGVQESLRGIGSYSSGRKEVPLSHAKKKRGWKDLTAHERAQSSGRKVNGNFRRKSQRGREAKARPQSREKEGGGL